jgi:hypothetical protein
MIAVAWVNNPKFFNKESLSMKKITSLTGIIVLAALLSTSAYAVNKETGTSNNPPNQQDFYEKTAPLRTTLAADQAEFNALMAGTNPDSKRIRALAENISRAQDELRNVASTYADQVMGSGGGHHMAMNGNGHNGQEPHMNGSVEGHMNNSYMGCCR